MNTPKNLGRKQMPTPYPSNIALCYGSDEQHAADAHTLLHHTPATAPHHA